MIKDRDSVSEEISWTETESEEASSVSDLHQVQMH